MPEPVNFRQLLEQQLVKTERLQAQIKKLEASRTEPIAITGLGCRLPGGGVSPEAFWQALRAGVDAIREVPADRWKVGGAAGERPETRWGGFLEAVDGFDAGFFGIAPREAETLDPQQRLLLEVTWEALENAGQPPDQLSGSRTGVFVGISTMDYQRQVLTRPEAELDAYAVTGNMSSVAAGRLSYVLGLQGPCASIDTACSSSLVAVHLACQSLRGRECDLAIAGGVNVLLSPVMMDLLARTQGLSPDGRCKTFDAAANGFVRAEGCGVVVLKRLSDALRDRDPIWALIRGSAVNQDGRSTGLTTPNVLSQQALLRQALESARVAPSQIGYVEAHGTGTSLGDPIEIEALKEVLGGPRADGSPCVLGSVKTNIGHLEAGAGVAGLIKAVLALKHEVIPRHLHFRTLNPRISLDGTPFVIPREELPWKAGSAPRFAGTSSFGLSGTNAHVILEEAPTPPAAAEDAAAPRAVLLAVSARDPGALRALAAAYHDHLQGAGAAAPLADVAYTASVRRSHHDHRLAVVGSGHDEIARGLDAFARGVERPGVISGRKAPGAPPKVAFVFSGQGSHWLGMGRHLHDEEPVFRQALEACDAALRKHGPWSLLEELRAGEAASRLERTEVVQPVIFAMGVALAALWRSWGVEPGAVVGHSVGEVAAAYVAGALSLEDAALIVHTRSHLMRRADGKGAVAVIELPEAEVAGWLAGSEGRVVIAGINSPGATLVSGERAAVGELLARLEQAEVGCRRVKMEVASHSPQMDALRDDLLEALKGVRPRAGAIAIHSTVTGEACDGASLDAAYWARNLREPVQFARAIQRLAAGGPVSFVEISAHPILLSAVAATLREGGGAVGAAVPSLRRGRPERATMLESLAALHVQGYPVDLRRLHPGGGRCVVLPAYPWQRRRYWVAPAAGRAAAQRAPGAHPLLGAPLTSSIHPGTRFWEAELGPDVVAYLADHKVQDAVVLPAAAYLEMAIAAAWDALGAEQIELEEVSFRDALAFRPGERCTVQTVLELQEPGAAAFRVVSSEGAAGRLQDARWRVHASGRLRWEPDVTAAPAGRREALGSIQARCPAEIAGEDYYDAFADQGVTYGPAFQGVRRVWKGAGEALAEVRLPEDVVAQASAHRVHPALLDASFHVLLAALGEGGGEDSPAVPVSLRRLRIHRRPEGEVWSHGRVPGERMDASGFEGDVALLDSDGQLLVEVEGLRLQRIDPARPAEEVFLTLRWERADAPPSAAGADPRGRWLILADEGGLGEQLAAALTARGEEVACAVAALRAPAAGQRAVDPTSPASFEALFRSVFADGAPCAGVLHLWSLDASPPERTSLASLEVDQQRGCGSALHLLQGLGRAGLRKPPRLWFVTRGAQAAGAKAEAVAVAQAPLWGLARTIWLEHREVTCARVDLAPGAPAGEIDALAGELLSESREDEVALRPDGRYVGRLVRSATPPDAGAGAAPDPAPLGADGTYLVTGGLGGLGLAAARWLVERGARHLLLGRQGAATDAQAEGVRALEAAGVRVVVARADVSDRARLAALLEDARGRLPPLRGVLHAAGVIDDGLLAAQDVARMREVMAPKVAGA